MALQILGDVLIGLVVVVRGSVRLPLEQPLIPFTPVVFVFAVVVIPRFGDSHFEEVRIPEHGIRRSVTSARVAVNPRFLEVNPRIPLRQLLHPGQLVR